MRGIITATALSLALSGCGPSSPAATAQQEKVSAPVVKTSIDGFGDLKFGMSFAEASTLVGVESLNSAAVKECLVELAIHGCLAMPATSLDSYVTIDGVPYGAGLSFNRYDKLTDISLIYKREEIMDPDERMPLKDCKALNERTVDWMYRDYGPFELKQEEGVVAVNTAKGNAYSEHTGDGAYLATIQKDLADKRRVSLITFYMSGDKTNCRIDVHFADLQSVERRDIDK